MFELSLIGAVASAILAGVFFAFSSFIMTALGNIEPSAGIKAMQRINIDVFCWPFFALFFGTPFLSFYIGAYALLNLPLSESTLFFIAGLIQIIGSLLVTLFGNVPLNNSLAKLDPNAVDSHTAWKKYLVTWTRWNHLRALACLTTSIIYFSSSNAFL